MRLSFKFLFSSLEKEIKNVIQKNINTIPFHINRTLSDNLAVFVKYRNNGNLAFTHIRKVKGNRFILKEELQQIIGRAPIRVNKDCFIIPGNHKHKIKQNTDGILISLIVFMTSLTTMVVSWAVYGETISQFYRDHVSPEFGRRHKKEQ